MHILLTDQLTCPRCGPEFGLILLADEITDRRVRGGRLGCPNCRTAYPISEGVADLRVAGQEPAAALPLRADEERATRTAALLGVTGPGAAVLVVAQDGSVAGEMAELLTEVHVLAALVEENGSGAPATGVVSRFRVAGPLPLRAGSVRGAAILGVDPAALLDELARVVVPGGRIVLEPAGKTAASECRDRGLEILLEEADVVVASTPGRR